MTKRERVVVGIDSGADVLTECYGAPAEALAAAFARVNDGKAAVASGGGILLSGPSGSGKTHLVAYTAARLGLALVRVGPVELLSGSPGSSGLAGAQCDTRVREAFARALDTAHRDARAVVLFFDAIDSVFPLRSSDRGGKSDASDSGAWLREGSAAEQDTNLAEISFEVEADALRCAVGPGEDGSCPRVLLVAASCGAVSLRLDSCFTLRLALRLPTVTQRRAIVQSIARTFSLRFDATASAPGRSLADTFADRCSGFVASDFASTLAEARRQATARERAARKATGIDENRTTTLTTAMTVTASDLLSAELRTASLSVAARSRGTAAARSSGIGREDVSNAGNNSAASARIDGIVRWADVCGVPEAKARLLEMAVWPQTRAAAFARLGLAPISGVLLFGPPGTGKTMLARAVAAESGSAFLSVSISDVVKGEVGESEKILTGLFARARRLAPCILFFDEFQALFGSRGNGGGGGLGGGAKLVSQFLLELDALALASRRAGSTVSSAPSSAPRVMVLAATNLPGAVDAAFLRPGRFDRVVLVPPPDAKGRVEIMRARRRKALARHGGEIGSHSDSLWSDDIDISLLCRDGGPTEGFTGADLDCLCQTAALLALQEAGRGSSDTGRGSGSESGNGDVDRDGDGNGDQFQIRMRHFESAAETIEASVTDKMMQALSAWEERRAHR